MEFFTIRTFLLDLRYGGYCGGTIPSRFESLGSNSVQSTEYHYLEELFRRAGIQVDPADVLVDIGCGKGRVINYWLAKGYRNRMIGLELEPDIADWARRRLKPWSNVEIIAGDAVTNLPEDGTVFYAANPFNAAGIAQLKARLDASSHGKRKVALLYWNCHHKGLFENDPAWRVESLGHVGPLPAALITRANCAMPQKLPALDPNRPNSERSAVISARQAHS